MCVCVVCRAADDLELAQATRMRSICRCRCLRIRICICVSRSMSACKRRAARARQAEALLDKGGDVCIKNNQGWTPLFTVAARPKAQPARRVCEVHRLSNLRRNWWSTCAHSPGLCNQLGVLFARAPS